jgi:integration host factor subunit beta
MKQFTERGYSMTKSELIEVVAQKSNISRDKAAIVVNKIFDSMIEAMKKDDRIEIRNFGNFTIKYYEGYLGRNPKTGTKVDVRPKKMPFFKVGLELKKLVNS